MERAYPVETELLLSWIERHVGVRLPLASLNPDRSVGKFSVFSGLTPGSAVEHLVEGLADDTEPRTLRRDFARDIHYGGKYDEALRIVELLLRDDPDDFDTLDLRACILFDQNDLGTALALARELTIQFPTRYRSWCHLVKVNRELGDWHGVLEATDGIIALPGFAELPPYQRDDTYESRATAQYELGALDAALQDLDRMSKDQPPRVAKRVEELRVRIRSRLAALAR